MARFPTRVPWVYFVLCVVVVVVVAVAVAVAVAVVLFCFVLFCLDDGSALPGVISKCCTFYVLPTMHADVCGAQCMLTRMARNNYDGISRRIIAG